MPADDLTPSQVAQLLQVEPSTLRRWSRQHKDRLSPQAQGARRKYTTEDVALLGRVRDLMRSGRKSPSQVGQLLDTLPDPTPPATTALTVPALAGQVQQAEERVRALLAHLDELQVLADANRAELDELRQAQAADRTRLEQLEQALAEWRALPWWKRIIARPPTVPATKDPSR